LGWVADENIQLSGLPPSQGGLTDAEVRALVAAGWELDTQGISHADLITLDGAELHYQVAAARQIVQKRYAYERAIRSLVARGVKRGEFAACDAALVTRAMLGAVNWTARWYRR